MCSVSTILPFASYIYEANYIYIHIIYIYIYIYFLAHTKIGSNWFRPMGCSFPQHECAQALQCSDEAELSG